MRSLNDTILSKKLVSDGMKDELRLINFIKSNFSEHIPDYIDIYWDNKDNPYGKCDFTFKNVNDSLKICKLQIEVGTPDTWNLNKTLKEMMSTTWFTLNVPLRKVKKYKGIDIYGNEIYEDFHDEGCYDIFLKCRKDFGSFFAISFKSLKAMCIRNGEFSYIGKSSNKYMEDSNTNVFIKIKNNVTIPDDGFGIIKNNISRLEKNNKLIIDDWVRVIKIIIEKIK
jgi:hypothetical protein